MAPTITAAIANSQDLLSLNHKIRKPLVEKLRRERINSSIEQLKSLLGPEFLKQQPDSKLEKADILEMTVCFLTQLQQHRAVDSAAVQQGYFRCVQEAVHFSPSRRLTFSLSSTVQTSSTKDKSLSNAPSGGPGRHLHPEGAADKLSDHIGQKYIEGILPHFQQIIRLCLF
uniref:Transcription factor HES-5 n=1 Tax=Salarias fasciatus TaxID=181472 RepID=A0A672J9V8_SALFA